MKVKKEREKVGLKLNIQKTKIMASGPITRMSLKSAQNAVSRMMQATDPDAIPKEVSLEEKVRLLEMQNKILRFHLSAQLERGQQSSPEDVVKKKR